MYILVQAYDKWETKHNFLIVCIPLHSNRLRREHQKWVETGKVINLPKRTLLWPLYCWPPRRASYSSKSKYWHDELIQSGSLIVHKKRLLPVQFLVFVMFELSRWWTTHTHHNQLPYQWDETRTKVITKINKPLFYSFCREYFSVGKSNTEDKRGTVYTSTRME